MVQLQTQENKPVLIEPCNVTHVSYYTRDESNVHLVSGTTIRVKGTMNEVELKLKGDLLLGPTTRLEEDKHT